MNANLLSFNRLYLKNYDGLSAACWAGIMLNLVESLLIGVYYFLSLYFINELHLSIKSSGLILSCYGIGAVVGGIVGGKLSDKLSSWFVMSVCLFTQAISYISLLLFTSIPVLMCILALLGVATYAFLTANHTWVLSQCNNDEGERLKAINILSTSSNLGLGVSAMIVSQLVSFGYHAIFTSTSLIFLLVAMLLFMREPKSIIFSDVKVDSHDQAQVISEESNLKTMAYNRYIVWLTLACVFLVGVVVAQFGSNYSIYIQETFRNLDMNGVGILYATNAFLVVICSAPLGNAIKIFSKIQMVGAGGLLLGLGMLILAVSWSFMFAILACVIYTFGEIIFFSMAQFICYQSAEANKKGKSLGIYRSIYAMSRIVGPVSGGYVYMHMGGNTLWYLCGIIGLFCFSVCSISESIIS